MAGVTTCAPCCIPPAQSSQGSEKVWAQTVGMAWAAAPEWNNSSATYRSNLLLKIADVMEKHLEELESGELIPFKYCDEKGNVNLNSNPNGSLNNIAGIFNKNKNILGMMPHPERMADKILSGEDGIGLFLSLMN